MGHWSCAPLAHSSTMVLCPQSTRHLTKTPTWSSIRAASWAVCSKGVSVRVYFDLVSFQSFRYLIWKWEARGLSYLRLRKHNAVQANVSIVPTITTRIADDDRMLSERRWEASEMTFHDWAILEWEPCTYIIEDLATLFCSHVINSVIHWSKVESFYFCAVFFLGERKYPSDSCSFWFCLSRERGTRFKGLSLLEV